jgi:hypothetical protein
MVSDSKVVNMLNQIAWMKVGELLGFATTTKGEQAAMTRKQVCTRCEERYLAQHCCKAGFMEWGGGRLQRGKAL